MCFPEVLLLKHGPDRGIKGDSIGTHHAHAPRDEVTRGLGGHATVVCLVALLGIIGRRTGLNKHNVAFLEGVPYFLPRLVNVVNKDPRTLWLVAEVKHDPIGVTVLEWNTFGAWSLRASNMFDGIAVRSHMIARDEEVRSRKPLCTVCSCADTLSKFSPTFIHEHSRRLYLWESEHITMYRHRQIDETCHGESSLIFRKLCSVNSRKNLYNSC